MNPRFFTSKIGIILLAVIVASAIFGTASAATYNGLATKQNTLQAQWAQVENQYQRKIVLIPELVTTAYNYTQFERTTIENITRLRTEWLNAPNQVAQVNATNAIDQNLFRLTATYENYPELHSIVVVAGLMDELAGTENRITVERFRYNDDVRAYNNQVATFPGNVFAGMFGFQRAPYYDPIPGGPTSNPLNQAMTTSECDRESS